VLVCISLVCGAMMIVPIVIAPTSYYTRTLHSANATYKQCFFDADYGKPLLRMHSVFDWYSNTWMS
jgi:hypothetical protein